MDTIENKTNKRPLSPHLQIYKPQITSILSIFHRFTGVFLAFGLLLSVIFVFFTAMGEETYKWWNCIVNSLVGKGLFFLWLLAIIFHALNGVRYFLWDNDIGMSIPSVKWSGLFVCVLTLVLTCVLGILIWM
ncbi:MAG: hypothetical protein CFH32_00858 [Alphaproteobacteria bacterium MarineAlpha9_Bin2]|nr:MAG: hypothetical protein CFH32_00858 [Alphaproteobacteria bacterium MarineAlpha9_Bin2]